MNRKLNAPALLLVLTLLLLAVAMPAARAQPAQAPCTPGISFWEKTDPMDYIVDYLSGGRYHSWWIRRESARNSYPQITQIGRADSKQQTAGSKQQTIHEITLPDTNSNLFSCCFV